MHELPREDLIAEFGEPVEESINHREHTMRWADVRVWINRDSGHVISNLPGQWQRSFGSHGRLGSCFSVRETQKRVRDARRWSEKFGRRLQVFKEVVTKAWPELEPDEWRICRVCETPRDNIDPDEGMPRGWWGLLLGSTRDTMFLADGFTATRDVGDTWIEIEWNGADQWRGAVRRADGRSATRTSTIRSSKGRLRVVVDELRKGVQIEASFISKMASKLRGLL